MCFFPLLFIAKLSDCKNFDIPCIDVNSHIIKCLMIFTRAMLHSLQRPIYKTRELTFLSLKETKTIYRTKNSYLLLVILYLNIH